MRDVPNSDPTSIGIFGVKPALDFAAKRGYNTGTDMGGTTTEIIHRGASFLVQTQDNGPRAQAIETLVYRSGRLAYTRKASWQPLLGQPRFEAKLQEMINAQHEEVCAEIRDGRLDRVLFRG